MAVKKIPSYLKGLAERHARVQAEIESLETTIALSQIQVEHHREIAESALAALAAAQVKLHSLEVLINDYNEALDPSKISPVNSWKNRYGKRGQMELDALEMVRLARESGLTSHQIYQIFAKRLAWPLAGPLATTYKENRIYCVSKRLQKKGLIKNTIVDGEPRWVAVEFLPQTSDGQMKVLAQFQ